MTKSTDNLPSRSSLQTRIRDTEARLIAARDNYNAIRYEPNVDTNYLDALVNNIDKIRSELISLRNMFHDVSGI